MRTNLLGFIAVLVFNVVLFFLWSELFEGEKFGESNRRYLDYLNLCFIITILFWLAGQICSLIILRQKKYQWIVIMATFWGHSILGLVPLTIYTAGKVMRGIGETEVFDSGPWYAVSEILNLHELWTRGLSDMLEVWLLWILCVATFFMIIVWFFAKSEKVS